MKKIIFLLFVSISLSAFSAVGDTDSDEIVNALKQGNAEQFSHFFDNFIDLKLPDKDEIKNLGKTQAGVTMKSFFDANNVKGFELTSQREMSGTMYMAGKLFGSAKNYNITLMMKTKGDRLTIITIRLN